LLSVSRGNYAVKWSRSRYCIGIEKMPTSLNPKITNFLPL